MLPELELPSQSRKTRRILDRPFSDTRTHADYEYDGGADRGDGNQTKVTLKVDDDVSHDRVQNRSYDWRNARACHAIHLLEQKLTGTTKHLQRGNLGFTSHALVVTSTGTLFLNVLCGYQKQESGAFVNGCQICNDRIPMGTVSNVLERAGRVRPESGQMGTRHHLEVEDLPHE